MAPLKGLIAYHWQVKFQQRGWPSLRVVLLLDGGGPSADQVLDHLREFCEYEVVGVIVTQCSTAFLTMCAVAEDDVFFDVVDTADDYDDDDDHDDEDDNDDDVHEDEDDDCVSARSISLLSAASL